MLTLNLSKSTYQLCQIFWTLFSSEIKKDFYNEITQYLRIYAFTNTLLLYEGNTHKKVLPFNSKIQEKIS